MILDLFQATGTIPIDVRAFKTDFAVGGVLKWLCGGPGVAYLYVREDLRAKLRPALIGWSAHQRPFDFEPGAIDAREDSFRYLNGTPHIPALHACLPGLEILNRAGIRDIRAKSIRMTTRLLEGALERGWTRQHSAKSRRSRRHRFHRLPACLRSLSRTAGPRDSLRLSPQSGNSAESALLQPRRRMRFGPDPNRRNPFYSRMGKTRCGPLPGLTRQTLVQ